VSTARANDSCYRYHRLSRSYSDLQQVQEKEVLRKIKITHRRNRTSSSSLDCKKSVPKNETILSNPYADLDTTEGTTAAKTSGNYQNSISVIPKISFSNSCLNSRHKRN
jgi:hypothetical protein